MFFLKGRAVNGKHWERKVKNPNIVGGLHIHWNPKILMLFEEAFIIDYPTAIWVFHDWSVRIADIWQHNGWTVSFSRKMGLLPKSYKEE